MSWIGPAASFWPWAPAAAAGRQHPHDVAGPQPQRALVGQPLAPARSSPPGSSQFSPTAPGSPPASPHGCDTRRSVISDTVQSSSTCEVALDALAPGSEPGAT